MIDIAASQLARDPEKMYIQNLSQASAEKIMTGVVLRNHRDIIISYRITVQSPDLGSFLLKVLVIEVL